MTNFEKWKQTLTAEEIQRLMYKHHVVFNCEVCPARFDCPLLRSECVSHFKQWAAFDPAEIPVGVYCRGCTHLCKTWPYVVDACRLFDVTLAPGFVIAIEPITRRSITVPHKYYRCIELSREAEEDFTNVEE